MTSFIDTERVHKIEDSIVSDGNSYDTNSAVLVRTTDGFPFDVVIESELIDVMISKLGKDEKLSNYLKRELGNSFPNLDYRRKLTELIKEFGLSNLAKEIAVYNARFENSLDIKSKTM